MRQLLVPAAMVIATAVLSLGSSGLVMGCDDDDAQNGDAGAAADLGVRTGGSDAGSDADGGFVRVSESDIAAILDTLNSGEVEQAQTAQTQGLVTSDAQDFAAMMVTMHS